VTNLFLLETPREVSSQQIATGTRDGHADSSDDNDTSSKSGPSLPPPEIDRSMRIPTEKPGTPFNFDLVAVDTRVRANDANQDSGIGIDDSCFLELLARSPKVLAKAGQPGARRRRATVWTGSSRSERDVRCSKAVVLSLLALQPHHQALEDAAARTAAG